MRNSTNHVMLCKSALKFFFFFFLFFSFFFFFFFFFCSRYFFYLGNESLLPALALTEVRIGKIGSATLLCPDGRATL